MATGASGIRAGRAFVELGVSDKMTRALKRAQTQLLAFGQSARQVGMNLLKVATVGATPFALATRRFAMFDDQMRVVGAVTGATAKQLAAMTIEAERLGRTTSFTATQVAEGMTELGRMGFDSDQIVTMTQSMLNLARATGVEVSEASLIAGSAMRQFNLEANDMTAIADILTKTANSSAQTVTDLGEALKMAGPIANVAGASIAETAAAIGILADVGIRGTMAGTMLARAYKNLTNEAKRNELMARLGIQAVDAAGNLRPVTEILRDMAVATKRMGTGDRLSVFEDLFGRGTAGAAKLAEKFTEFDSLLTEIENSAGTAEQAAADMDAGIGGAFRRMLSAVEGVAIAIGRAVEPVVESFTNQLKDFAAFITMFVQKNQGLFQSILKAVAITAVLGGALVAIGLAFGVMAFAIGGIIAAFKTTVLVLGLLGAAIKVVGVLFVKMILLMVTPVGLIVTAVLAIGLAFAIMTGEVSNAISFLVERFKTFRDIATKTWQGIVDAVMAGDLRLAAEIAMKGLEIAWFELVASMKMAWSGFTAFFKKLGSTAFNALLIGAQFVAHGITVAFIELSAFFTQLFHGITNVFMNVWDQATSWLAKRIVEVMGLFDGDIDVEATKEQINKDLLTDIERRDKEMFDAIKASMEKRDRKMQAESELHEGTLLEIGRQANETDKRIDDERRAGVAALKAERERLQKQLDEAVARAAEARKAASEGEDAPDRSTMANVQEMLDRVNAQIEAAQSSIATPTQGAENRGIFSGFNFQELQGPAEIVQKEQLKEQKKVAKNTKDIADNTENLAAGGTFGP